jgi:glycolate oxidase iron-sulfur subunit
VWKSRSWLLQKAPADSGLHFRFPLPDLERYIPKPPPASFLESLPPQYTNYGPQIEGGRRVALFAGCVGNYLRPQTPRAAVRLLESAGAKVIVPPDQVCCGKPAAGAGDAQTARRLMEKNLAAINPDKFDYLAVFCATCLNQIKSYAESGDEKAAALAEKAVDASQLLMDVLKWSPEKAESPAEALRVFYHDPCHLRRKLGVVEPPRRLLAALPGVELVGGHDPPVCCGYGGVFNLYHYDLSRNLFDRRLETIKEHAPHAAVTSCSGCWLQFQDGLHQAGRPFDAVPLLELAARRGLPLKDET